MGTKTKHRDVFFAHNGVGPYSCDFCDVLVTFEEVHVHHRDEDHWNDAPENLGASHPACHSRHHASGKPMPPHVKDAIRASNRRRALLPDHRAAISAGLKGHVVSAATRAKIGAANRRAWQRKREEAACAR